MSYQNNVKLTWKKTIDPVKSKLFGQLFPGFVTKPVRMPLQPVRESFSFIVYIVSISIWTDAQRNLKSNICIFVTLLLPHVRPKQN